MSLHTAGDGQPTRNVFEHLDEVVRAAGARPGRAARRRHAPDRAARLAAVFAAEAEAWSQVYELAHLRLIWRAALAAEAGARANAALWARRARRSGPAGRRSRAGLPVGWMHPARRPSPPPRAGGDGPWGASER